MWLLLDVAFLFASVLQFVKWGKNTIILLIQKKKKIMILLLFRHPRQKWQESSPLFHINDLSEGMIDSNEELSSRQYRIRGVCLFYSFNRKVGISDLAWEINQIKALLTQEEAWSVSLLRSKWGKARSGFTQMREDKPHTSGLDCKNWSCDSEI